MSKDIKSFIESLIPSSNNSLKEKCVNIFQENGIETTDDLLCLTEKDIDTFSLPLVFKRKMLDEMNKLKNGPSLTEVEKKLMKSISKERWIKTHHQLIFFGRYHCKAQKPNCNNCKLQNLCKYHKTAIK